METLLSHSLTERSVNPLKVNIQLHVRLTVNMKRFDVKYCICERGLTVRYGWPKRLNSILMFLLTVAPNLIGRIVY